MLAKNISWRYYGGGFNDAVAGRPNAFCAICNPMQYVSSIMTNPAVRTTHIKDVVDLFADIDNKTLPAVSFVKPSELVDGHPLSSKLDLFEAMNRGSLILINTAKDLLKQDGCEILWRFFIALICQAAQERAAISSEHRRSTFLYIDEAHDYFDQSIEQLLNQARKYKVGIILAHQNLDQFEPRLRGAVMASTSA